MDCQKLILLPCFLVILYQYQIKIGNILIETIAGQMSTRNNRTI